MPENFSLLLAAQGDDMMGDDMDEEDVLGDGVEEENDDDDEDEGEEDEDDDMDTDIENEN